MIKKQVELGLGLRFCHEQDYFNASSLALSHIEIITENHLGRGGKPLALLERAQHLAKLICHGVSLNLGGVDPLNRTYLQQLKQFKRQFKPVIISDHLCFGGFGGHYAHDLWPLPYCEEAVTHVVERIRHVQDYLETAILIENVSSYVACRDQPMTEWQFLDAIVSNANCYILLDINNLYINAVNHQFSPQYYLEGLATDRVKQYHLAGHDHRGHYLFDNHGAAVATPVWELYRQATKRFGLHPTILEWDENVPSLTTVINEVHQARSWLDEAVS